MNAGVDLTSTIAGYLAIEQLYCGSRTLVYRAIREVDVEDGSAKRLGQPVVIKILRRDYPTFNELLLFRNHYTIAKNLRQPGVVEPYSLEFYRNSYALVMEDFGGISLKEYVQTYDLELNEFLTVALQLSEILNGLYCNRVIYKDIKSANILIHPVIMEVIPELERIIGSQPPVPELSGVAAQNLFYLLFHKFISVLTTKEHPLVMFLDDLQWADSASLKLMQLLVSEAQSSYLLLIGAYRDNEVSSAHFPLLTLDEVSKAVAKSSVVEKHGGTIEVNSVFGQGTEFSSSLPVKS